MLCYSVVASNMIFIANLVIDEEKENDPLQLLISPFIKEYSPLCMWLHGKSEKNWFLSGMGFFEGQFLRKITEKSGKSNFKAAEVIHMT